jgi:IAA-amino acid hydrolase
MFSSVDVFDVLIPIFALKGTVRLLFQPAEEGARGASHMIKEGVLQDVEAIFAVHIDDTTSTGAIASIPGPLTAAGSIFEAKVEGVGGHAALPHQAVDPLLATSFTILALQQLVSREIDPLHSQVCATLNLYFRKKIYP